MYSLVMRLLFSSFRSALLSCFRPRVIWLSFSPFILLASVTSVLAYLCWEPVLIWMRHGIKGTGFLSQVWSLLEVVGIGGLNLVIGPLILILMVMPFLVVFSLLVVSALATPRLIELISRLRFPELDQKKNTSLWGGLWWTLRSTSMALVALIVSFPLWLLPMVVLILPPVIWGWLTYRIMAFDALAEHASTNERKNLFEKHRWMLLFMGVVCGYLTALPTLVLASGAMVTPAFIFLMPLAIWLYMFIFIFSSMWFAYYCLEALSETRL